MEEPQRGLTPRQPQNLSPGPSLDEEVRRDAGEERVPACRGVDLCRQLDKGAANPPDVEVDVGAGGMFLSGESLVLGVVLVSVHFGWLVQRDA